MSLMVGNNAAIAPYGKIRVRCWRRLLDKHYWELIGGYMYETDAKDHFIKTIEELKTEDEWVEQMNNDPDFEFKFDREVNRKSLPKETV